MNFDQILQETKEKLVIDKAVILKEVEQAIYYCDNIAILEFLANDTCGVYMVTHFLRSCGIKIEDEVVYQEGWEDFVYYRLFELINEIIDIENVFIDFAEGGLCLLHYKENEGENDDDDDDDDE